MYVNTCWCMRLLSYGVSFWSIAFGLSHSVCCVCWLLHLVYRTVYVIVFATALFVGRFRHNTMKIIAAPLLPLEANLAYKGRDKCTFMLLHYQFKKKGEER